MRIKELYLKNFRCFEEMTINFPTSYTVFVGNNGVGKSSILNALRMVLDGFVDIIQYDLRKTIVFVHDEPIYKHGNYNEIFQESDVLIKTIPLGSTWYKKSQYPMVIKSNIEISETKTISYKYESKNTLKNNKNLKNFFEYANELQNKIINNENVNLPLINYYGIQRQWYKTENKSENSILFMPQLNGYVNALSAKPFNIEVMRHWFSRMLLIARKKPVPEFEAVRNAISSCYKGIDDRKNLKDVIIDYDAEQEDIEIQMYFYDDKVEVLPLHYLSDGAKSILAIVADIAYRMAVLNPHLLDKVITDTDGIVLIDEIDMHLHPSWQRKIVESLTKTFPKVQFIFTTHSPTVLTHVPRENIQILSDGKVYPIDSKTYGRDVNSILREVMETEVRPTEIQEKLDNFSEAIFNRDLDVAEKILNELRDQLGDDEEVVSSQVTLDLEKAEVFNDSY